MAQITVTLTKSPIGRIPAQRRTVKALGLGKLGSSVEKEDTAANRAMAASIAHLVTITEGGKAEKKTAKRAAVAKTAVKKETATKSKIKKPVAKKANAESSTKTVEKKVAPKASAKPTAANKVAEIKEYLDEQGIKHPSTAKKTDLLELVK
jgi:large subunit ribosomal protein L30